MWLASIGVVLNLLATLGVQAQTADLPDSSGKMILTIVVLVWALSLLGLILIAAGKKKAGGILVIVGSIAFVPLGLVAMIGARNVMKAAKDDLAERRQLASTDGGAPPAA
ncbi:hypothetical protein [Burkholderia guangdongensis]|uniref:hypothetical protein n=1 Tax=Burkholderia guangdongensis TaxID=1792500 RepID=UPI0015CDFAF7|nr:hypothetical protein [Burkholderia guangdongensis]